jgi:hypothetical protein
MEFEGLVVAGNLEPAEVPEESASALAGLERTRGEAQQAKGAAVVPAPLAGRSNAQA